MWPLKENKTKICLVSEENEYDKSLSGLIGGIKKSEARQNRTKWNKVLEQMGRSGLDLEGSGEKMGL